MAEWCWEPRDRDHILSMSKLLVFNGVGIVRLVSSSNASDVCEIEPVCKPVLNPVLLSQKFGDVHCWSACNCFQVHSLTNKRYRNLITPRHRESCKIKLYLSHKYGLYDNGWSCE